MLRLLLLLVQFCCSVSVISASTGVSTTTTTTTTTTATRKATTTSRIQRQQPFVVVFSSVSAPRAVSSVEVQQRQHQSQQEQKQLLYNGRHLQSTQDVTSNIPQDVTAENIQQAVSETNSTSDNNNNDSSNNNNDYNSNIFDLNTTASNIGDLTETTNGDNSGTTGGDSGSDLTNVVDSVTTGGGTTSSSAVNMSSMIPAEFDLVYKVYAPSENSTDGAIPADTLTLITNQVQQSLTDLENGNTGTFNITTIGDTVLSGCDDATAGAEVAEGLDLCQIASTTITAAVAGNMDPELLKELLNNAVQEALTNLMEDPGVLMKLLFTGSTYATTSVRVTFQGVLGIMNEAELNLMKETFQTGFGEAFMSKASPVPMTLVNTKIVFQKLSVFNNTATSFILPTSYNDVEFYIAATCEGDACTDDYLTDYVMNEGNVFASSTWRLELQRQGTDNGTSYFEPLERISIATDFFLLQDTLRGVSSSIEGDMAVAPKYPDYLWIVLAVDLFLLLLGVLTCVFLVTRRKDAVLEPPAKEAELVTHVHDRKNRHNDYDDIDI